MPVILKPRTDEKQKTVVCGNCGATIGYYPSEVSPFIVPPRPSKGNYIPRPLMGWNITCPSCGYHIMLREKEYKK